MKAPKEVDYLWHHLLDFKKYSVSIETVDNVYIMDCDCIQDPEMLKIN